MKRLNLSRNDVNADDGHEHAIVSLTGGSYNGARATINLWNPKVVGSEVSFSQIWLAAGPEEDINTVEAGWMVNRELSDSGEAEFFVYWTSDGYKESGCYNLRCKGFVQTNEHISLEAPIRPVSTYGGQQYDIPIEITKNQFAGWWELSIADTEVGFWHPEYFTYLRGPADKIDWGGEIANDVPGRPTSTEMGSGHFPSEGYGRASYFRTLKFIDDGFVERDPENLEKIVTKPECYDLLLNVGTPNFGVHFYYGGPGVSAQCTT
ncbi:hypothetical protein NL676_035398 [Syzygium grande]|nr:hypothetical protein NL676_035398 [Syzygium grande]